MKQNLAIIAAVSVIASPVYAQQLPDLTKALLFENAQMCESRAIASFFESGKKRGWATLPSIGRVQLVKSHSRRNSSTFKAPVKGKWNGLTIIALELDHEVSGMHGYDTTRILFAERASTVAPILSRLGFGLSRAGQTKEVYDEETMMDPLTLSLKAAGSGAVFECGY